MHALSPSRYWQVCRYLLQRYLVDRTSKARGKARLPSLAMASTAQHHHHRDDQYPYGEHGGVGPSSRPLRPDPDQPPEPQAIYRLMNDERLLVPGSVKPPRETVVLCHGLYGFSTATPIPLFPSLRLHYWASVLQVLHGMDVDVVVVGVPGTGSIKERAEEMHRYLSDTLPKGTGVNFVAHSMGGLDARHLISIIKPKNYTPVSLTTIGTPHRGSPFMDWCAANIGVGTASTLASAMEEAAAALPFSLKSPLLARTEQAVQQATGGLTSFTSALSRHLLNVFDSPAYSNLTTSFCRDVFNPETQDDPSVKYISVAGRTKKLSVLHPLWFTKLVLDAAAEKGYPSYDSGKNYQGNDGLVSVGSAKWGEFLGAVDDTHHWNLRGEGGIWPNGLGDGDSKKKDKRVAHEQQSDELVMSGGWDWEDGVEEYLGLNLEQVKRDLKDKGIDVAKELEQRAGKRASDNNSKKAGWDVAQVGQVLDWISDLIPGGASSEAGKREIAEARAETASDMNKEKKDKKDKFDLAKFYGGLMLKLREDGF